MGNKASSASARSRLPSAAVVGPHGDVQHVETPVVAAEIMMEAPGHVVARAEEVARTRRAVGMRADEALRPGELYVLLPLERVGSRLSDRQMAFVLESVGKKLEKENKNEKKKKEIMGSRRVFPEVAGRGREEEERGVEKREDKQKVVWEGETAGFSCKLVRGRRQWRPVLDTIQETRSI